MANGSPCSSPECMVSRIIAMVDDAGDAVRHIQLMDERPVR
jgi:hypothetical protein